VKSSDEQAAKDFQVSHYHDRFVLMDYA